MTDREGPETLGDLRKILAGEPREKREAIIAQLLAEKIIDALDAEILRGEHEPQ